MIEIMIPFLLAHILGDFVWQPTAWVLDKQKKKLKSKYLYLHLFIHFSLLLLLTQFRLAYLPVILGITCFHGVIDVLKIYCQKENNAKQWFFIDQFLHVFILVLGAYLLHQVPIDTWINIVYLPKNLWFITTFLLATYVTGITQKILLAPWASQMKVKDQAPSNNAGWYIGILERSFVFLFVVLHFWSGVGFILAAKSIFRIGDLTKPKDVAVTEYILIGTFLSFGFAVFFGLLYKITLPYLAT